MTWSCLQKKIPKKNPNLVRSECQNRKIRKRERRLHIDHKKKTRMKIKLFVVWYLEHTIMTQLNNIHNFFNSFGELIKKFIRQ